MIGSPGIRTPPAPDNVGRSETSQWPHSCGPRALGRLFSALPPNAPERPASTSRGTTRAGLRAGAGAAALPMGSRRRVNTVRHLAVTRRRGAGPRRSGTARESTCARRKAVRGRREVVKLRAPAPPRMGGGGCAPPRVARHLHGGPATAGMRPPTAAGAHQRMSNGVKRLQARGGFPEGRGADLAVGALVQEE